MIVTKYGAGPDQVFGKYCRELTAVDSAIEYRNYRSYDPVCLTSSGLFSHCWRIILSFSVSTTL
eukprot:jgi/Psemu1/303148/fgenesh1_kg.94_\